MWPACGCECPLRLSDLPHGIRPQESRPIKPCSSVEARQSVVKLVSEGDFKRVKFGMKGFRDVDIPGVSRDGVQLVSVIWPYVGVKTVWG